MKKKEYLNQNSTVNIVKGTVPVLMNIAEQSTKAAIECSKKSRRRWCKRTYDVATNAIQSGR